MKKVIITEEQLKEITAQEMYAFLKNNPELLSQAGQTNWPQLLHKFMLKQIFGIDTDMENNSNATAGQPATNVSNDAIAAICQFETGKQLGYKMSQKDLYGYDNGDAGGKKTYGYGLLFHPSGKKYMQDVKPVWTQPELEQLFSQMVQKKGQKIADWANANGVQLSQGQFDAMTSALYNFGNKFLNFNICKLIAQNPNNPQIPTMWAHLSDAQAKKYPGLLKRRNAEAGWYQSDIQQA